MKGHFCRSIADADFGLGLFEAEAEERGCCQVHSKPHFFWSISEQESFGKCSSSSRVFARRGKGKVLQRQRPSTPAFGPCHCCKTNYARLRAEKDNLAPTRGRVALRAAAASSLCQRNWLLPGKVAAIEPVVVLTPKTQRFTSPLAFRLDDLRTDGSDQQEKKQKRGFCQAEKQIVKLNKQKLESTKVGDD